MEHEPCGIKSDNIGYPWNQNWLSMESRLTIGLAGCWEGQWEQFTWVETQRQVLTPLPLLWKSVMAPQGTCQVLIHSVGQSSQILQLT